MSCYCYLGRFKFTDDEAKVIGIDSDGTPTDDASSVSSADTKRRTPTRLLSRHNGNNDGGYAISSPSDSDGAYGYWLQQYCWMTLGF